MCAEKPILPVLRGRHPHRHPVPAPSRPRPQGQREGQTHGRLHAGGQLPQGAHKPITRGARRAPRRPRLPDVGGPPQGTGIHSQLSRPAIQHDAGPPRLHQGRRQREPSSRQGHLQAGQGRRPAMGPAPRLRGGAAINKRPPTALRGEGHTPRRLGQSRQAPVQRDAGPREQHVPPPHSQRHNLPPQEGPGLQVQPGVPHRPPGEEASLSRVQLYGGW